MNKAPENVSDSYDSESEIDEETFDRFFNNVEGVVFYYTTGEK